MYVELEEFNLVDQLSSSTSSSYPSSNSSTNITRLKRKLSISIVNDISSCSASSSRKESSKTVPWGNVIARDAIRIEQDIILDSESEDVPLSTPPSFILDASSMLST